MCKVASKRRQYRIFFFGKMTKIAQLPKQALLANPNGIRPVGRPRTRWINYIKDLAWNRFGTSPKAKWWRWWKTVVKCAGGLISSCCRCKPHAKAGNEERKPSDWELRPQTLRFRYTWYSSVYSAVYNFHHRQIILFGVKPHPQPVAKSWLRAWITLKLPIDFLFF